MSTPEESLVLVQNHRDVCAFCKRSGKLIKSLLTGKCICPKCVKEVEDVMGEIHVTY